MQDFLRKERADVCRSWKTRSVIASSFKRIEEFGSVYN
jgi:hypothetical protein